MRTHLMKVALAGAALAAAVATITPASADPRWCGQNVVCGPGGGWGGGHRDGGWHGERGRGPGWGPALAFGALGLATGAIIASQAQPYYAPAPVYLAPPPPPDGDGCWERRAVYDRWGRFEGRRLVNVCD